MPGGVLISIASARYIYFSGVHNVAIPYAKVIMVCAADKSGQDTPEMICVPEKSGLSLQAMIL